MRNSLLLVLSIGCLCFFNARAPRLRLLTPPPTSGFSIAVSSASVSAQVGATTAPVALSLKSTERIYGARDRDRQWISDRYCFLAGISNLGRDKLVGLGFWPVDAALLKNVRIHDRLQLQFRAEAFNVFHHTNFLIGDNASLHDPLFGIAGGTAPPRNLQFGLKLSF